MYFMENLHVHEYKHHPDEHNMGGPHQCALKSLEVQQLHSNVWKVYARLSYLSYFLI